MALNPSGNHGMSWNYSNPNEEGYSTELIGTVVALQEVQAMQYGSNQPRFWPEGNPIMNIRMVLAGPSGGIRTFVFQPASAKAKAGQAKSIHMDLFALAGGVDMLGLIGKTIKLSTVEPPQGFGYGQGNPRPWHVEEVPGVGPYVLKAPLDPIFTVPRVFANQSISGGQVVPQVPPQAVLGTNGQLPPRIVNPTTGEILPPEKPLYEDIPF